jgi:asparaginyl-tRNA synthetase
MQVYIEQLDQHVGEEVTIRGWLYNLRSSGKVRFILVRDGTGIVQSVIAKDECSEDIFESTESIPQESSLIICGIVKKEPRAPGGYELVTKEIKIVQRAEPYPITPKEHSIEYLLPLRHLWLRSKNQHAIMRIRHEMIKAFRDFLDDRGFINADCPILTPSACEGTTTLFEVAYYDQKAYLSQSGQLYNEATAAALGKVYCFGPTFRAEKSKTRKHLTEFWMLEPEAAFLELDGIMELAEDMVIEMINRVVKNRTPELTTLARDITKLTTIKKPFPRITYKEAVAIVKEKESAFNYGDDFGAPHEAIIGDHFTTPVFVHHYPTHIKAFYMKQDPQNPELSLSVDMIGPEGYGELVGGGQREDNHDRLRKHIIEHGLPETSFQWYLDLRKYGTCPHGGFGLGLERTIAWICGIKHVRETIPFPRMLDKIYP